MSDVIDMLLAESELQDDVVLRDVLAEIEREAIGVRPMPSAELAAVMTRGGARGRRSFASRGALITGIAVIGALGLGVGAAAANPEVRSSIGAGIAVIVHLVEGKPLPAPAVPPGVHAPAPGSDASLEPSAPAAPSPSAPPDSAAPGSSNPGNANVSAPNPAAPAPGGPNPVGPNPGNGSGDAGGPASSGSGTGSGNSGKGDPEGPGSGKGNQNGHGNGKGNHSGNGNGKGQGNGGPAPLP